MRVGGSKLNTQHGTTLSETLCNLESACMGGDYWVLGVLSRSTARAHSRVDGSTMMPNPSALRMLNKVSISSSSTVLLYARGVGRFGGHGGCPKSRQVPSSHTSPTLERMTQQSQQTILLGTVVMMLWVVDDSNGGNDAVLLWVVNGEVDGSGGSCGCVGRDAKL